MFRYTSHSSGRCLLVLLVTSSIAVGQIPGVDIWPDDKTDDKCDLIHAANAELVVLSATGELVLVSADDIILDGTFVDKDGAVFVDDDPAGSLRFAEDADGFPTLWWLAFNGRVMSIDGLSGDEFDISASELLPSDIGNTTCAACDGFWDIEADCVEPEPPPVVVNVFPLCGLGFGTLMMGMTFVALAGMHLVRTRTEPRP